MFRFVSSPRLSGKSPVLMPSVIANPKGWQLRESGWRHPLLEGESMAGDGAAIARHDGPKKGTAFLPSSPGVDKRRSGGKWPIQTGIKKPDLLIGLFTLMYWSLANCLYLPLTGCSRSLRKTTTLSNTSTSTGWLLSISPARIFLLNPLTISFWMRRFKGRAPNCGSNPFSDR